VPYPVALPGTRGFSVTYIYSLSVCCFVLSTPVILSHTFGKLTSRPTSHIMDDKLATEHHQLEAIPKLAANDLAEAQRVEIAAHNMSTWQTIQSHKRIIAICGFAKSWHLVHAHTFS
jgi:hypothetical protein